MAISPPRPNPLSYAPDFTLADALEVASEHWSGRPGHAVQMSRATRCVDLLGPALRLADVGRDHDESLAAALEAAGIGTHAAHDYSATFRTVLRLSGHALEGWPPLVMPKPRPAQPERLTLEDYRQAAEWLERKGWGETADLVWLIAGTGLRCTVEALADGLLTSERGEAYDTLRVAGRYAREVPVVDAHARAVLRAPERLKAIRAHSHSGHLQRLRKGLLGLGRGIEGGTFAAIRQAYAGDVYLRAGGNRSLVAALLGRA